ncbi:MAG: Z1 domain-containing protein [Chthoniobacter sp.]|uniref:Z1 domain-containing protein n=1 Tax=Chthoniobacter sp. TaxID=2510640 RepID=UPI0032A2AAC0
MSDDQQSDPNVETVQAAGGATPPGDLWCPVVGEQLKQTLEAKNLPAAEREIIERQTAALLAKCVPPSLGEGRDTGLALGYVQSGKTLSFTCVAALARDNLFPLVIVITGTSVPLFQQSVRRLRLDLGIDNPGSHEWRWQFFQNPTLKQHHHGRIRDFLAEWHEPRVLDKQTCLITVMKNHRHLSNLVDLLQALDIRGVPTLVIDDEADQAGLNTLVRQNDESRTYQRLLEVRDALPHHTYLQYTATPQAPLLINIIDVLSPRFVEVLEPGRGYVGLVDFFQRNQGLVQTIPDDEVPSALIQLHGAPESLREALRLFFLGVAAGKLLRSPERNRSMLVHPSRLQDKHADYFNWVSAVRTEWLRLLSADGDPDQAALLEDFQLTHSNLASTYPDVPAFSEIESVLWQEINRTQVWEVNARLGKTPDIVWQSGYAHILVGGQAMDRGFTVEGLTVTYMPRGKGVGNADTIQQRARFLGYKRAYLGLCRVFLESDVQRAFSVYVNHEEHVRELLRKHSSSGRSLAEWRRAFFLDRSLKPTRRNVLDLDYQHVNFTADWFYPRAPHFTVRAVEHNRALVTTLETLHFGPLDGHPERTDTMQVGYARVALEDLFQGFLSQFQHTDPNDSQRYTGLLLQVREFLDRNPEAPASIYLMSWAPASGQISRTRSLDANSELPSSGAFFQGASIGRGQHKTGDVYPGDRAIHPADEFAVQIHLLTLNSAGGTTVCERVPAIAIKLPPAMGGDTLIQDLPV